MTWHSITPKNSPDKYANPLEVIASLLSAAERKS
jgi:hypothetical protein